MKGNMEKLSVGPREKEKDRGSETAEFRLMAKAFNIQIQYFSGKLIIQSPEIS